MWGKEMEFLEIWDILAEKDKIYILGYNEYANRHKE